MDFDELYKTYFKDVYNFLYKLSGDHVLSEDITQETFIKAIKIQRPSAKIRHLKLPTRAS